MSYPHQQQQPPHHARPPYPPRLPQQPPAPSYGHGHGHAAPATGRRHTAPPTAAAGRRRRRWQWVLGAVVALFVVIGVAGGGDGRMSTSTAAPGAPAVPAAPAEAAASGTDTITYEVTGDGVSKATNITYVKDSNFGQQQENSKSLPWSKDVQMDAGLFDLQPMTLVAQSGSGGSGSITCRILRNGVEVTSSTSSGPYAVVTCNGGL